MLRLLPWRRTTRQGSRRGHSLHMPPEWMEARQHDLPATERHPRASIDWEQTVTVFGLPAGHASGAKNDRTPPPPEGRRGRKSLLIQMFSVASLFLGA